MVSLPSTTLPDTEHQARADLDAALERESPRLLALAYSVLHDRDAAHDVVQDTMERALRSWRAIRDLQRAPAWLSSVCVRQALGRLRAQRRSRLLPWSAGERASATRTLPGELDLDLARALRRRLSARQRAVVALHYVYGYTLDESAAALGCRPGTVRSDLHRALRTLREELER